MKIAVNTRMLLPARLEGIGNFTAESFKRIVQSHPEHEFIFLFDRQFDPSFIYGKNVTPCVVYPPARHPFLIAFWNEISVGYALQKHKPDVYVATDGFFPLHTKTKTLAVFHDICFIHYPKDLPFLMARYYNNFFPAMAKKAKRIAAVSEFTKDDVVKTLGTPASKFDIVYNGASEKFSPLNEIQINETRKQFSSGQPYFLFVGSIHQRKNIANMLRAFDQFKKSNDSPLKMVLAGAKRWWTDEMESTLNAMQFKNDVIFTGRVSHEDLCRLTASAFAITYVSNFEGFGIPIIEGMKSGVPVLTSNTSSMPEIAGGAALIADPFSVDSISDGMKKLANDSSLRAALIGKGLQRAKDFTWDKTAQTLWRAIEKTME